MSRRESLTPQPFVLHELGNHLIQRQASPLPQTDSHSSPRGSSPFLDPSPSSLSSNAGPSGRSRSLNKSTPLPYSKIFPLLIQRVAEGFGYAVIFPYINEMVLSMGVEEKSVGVWSSIAVSWAIIFQAFESSMMATEAMMAPLYAPLADRLGRRPVLIVLEILWGTFSFMFGFSKTVWIAIILRGCLGLLAGCGVISRTMVGELCDRSNRIQGFALFSPAITVGMTLAPLVGGFLAKPVPRLFPSSWTLLSSYPYLLPAVVAGLLAIASAALSCVLLPETLQRAQVDHRTHTRDAEKERGSRLGELLRYPKFQSCVSLYAPIYPLFCFTSKELGGLGLSAIGVVLGLSACLSIAMTVFVFPLFHRTFSEQLCLKLTLLSYPAAIVFFPALWTLSYPHQGDNLPLLVWTLMTLQMILRRIGDFAATQLDTIVFDAIPGPEHLVSANSMMFSLAAAGRAIGPFIISWFFSLSTRFASPYSPGRQIVWIAFFCLCLPSLYLATKLGEEMEKNKEEDGYEEERYELISDAGREGGVELADGHLARSV